MPRTPTRTDIRSNGSKSGGQQPDSIDTLLDVLSRETLHPSFEDYGNFTLNQDGETIRFWGNFLTVSHVFEIDTNDGELINRLRSAIRRNQGTDAYRLARAAHFGYEED